MNNVFNHDKYDIVPVTMRLVLDIANRAMNEIIPFNIPVASYSLVGSSALCSESLSKGSTRHSEALVGDIDVSLSMNDLLASMDLLDAINNPRKLQWEAINKWLTNKCGNLQWKINKGFNQIHFLIPLDTSEQQYCQFDILIGNVKWMRSILKGTMIPEESKYKALYRNALLVAIMPPDSLYNEKENSITRYIFDYRYGVRKITKYKDSEIDTIVIDDPDKFVSWLFKDKNIKWKHVNTFEKALSLLKSDDWFDRKDIIRGRLEHDLIRKKQPFPKELYS